LLNIKSENNTKRKFKAYLKACHIENYEEWITFSDEKLDDLMVKFWFCHCEVTDKILVPKVCRGIQDLPLPAWSQNSYPPQRFGGYEFWLQASRGKSCIPLRPLE
jgi:hypothetical protein